MKGMTTKHWGSEADRKAHYYVLYLIWDIIIWIVLC